jgi:hypothetical protein
LRAGESQIDESEQCRAECVVGAVEWVFDPSWGADPPFTGGRIELEHVDEQGYTTSDDGGVEERGEDRV